MAGERTERHSPRRRRAMAALAVSVWLLLCTVIAAGLVSLHNYIWAPLPPGLAPGQTPEWQGEGMAMLFAFFPGLAVFALLVVVPPVILFWRWLRRGTIPRRGLGLPDMAPGWYPDPWQAGGLRWFDGYKWTNDRS